MFIIIMFIIGWIWEGIKNFFATEEPKEKLTKITSGGFYGLAVSGSSNYYHYERKSFTTFMPGIIKIRDGHNIVKISMIETKNKKVVPDAFSVNGGDIYDVLINDGNKKSPSVPLEHVHLEKTATYIQKIALNRNLSKNHADACKALLQKIPEYYEVADIKGISINCDNIVLQSEGELALKRLLGLMNEEL
ncbi:hypothetical protein [Terribacillus saccharophilus]|uniref:hypothetical protein n=1 Tax=Terribacillus saccharophilus TaxID=361277 RepID=UPI002DC6C2E5|nr:hypothetical protein [Terribacillus saccharophilus]